MTLRRADPVADRLRGQALMRAAIAAGAPTYTPHPGELDWWLFHADPRQPAVELWLDDEVPAMVVFEPGRNEAFLVAPDLTTFARLESWVAGRARHDARAVTWISDRDAARDAHLRSCGYGPVDGGPVFQRPSAPLAADDRSLPEGYRFSTTVEAAASSADPEALIDSRADAARRSFESTMEPAMHRARYRRFMASPGYAPERDKVVLGRDGLVAAFAIWWADHELDLAQFEPVGTDPDHQGRGLGRALMAACIADIRAAGITQVRVSTEDERDAANALYRAAGFDLVDHVFWWTRPAG